MNPNSERTSETTSTRWSGAKLSRLEIPVGQELNDEYGLGTTNDSVVASAATRSGTTDTACLEVAYNDVSDASRAFYRVTSSDSRLVFGDVALDGGANQCLADNQGECLGA
jgi:putative transposase